MADPHVAPHLVDAHHATDAPQLLCQLTALPIPTLCPHVLAHLSQGVPGSIASTGVRTPGGNVIRPAVSSSRHAAMQLDSRSVPRVSTNAKRTHTARAKAMRPEKVVGAGISAQIC